MKRPREGIDTILLRLLERLDPALCEQRLKAVLEIGNEVLLPSGEPFFAFRLHQFLASGGSVFATIEPPDRRELTTEGRFYVGRGDDLKGARMLFPLAFCRRAGRSTTSSRAPLGTARNDCCRVRRCFDTTTRTCRASRATCRSSTTSSGTRTRTCPTTGSNGARAGHG